MLVKSPLCKYANCEADVRCAVALCECEFLH
jgi:hypothetical protein